MLHALDKKLIRDLVRIWAQALAVALVMACGVATIILAVGASRSLEETRTAFYDRYRFGSVFSSVVRAPKHLKPRIAAIPGVSATELRITEPVLLDVAGMAEPASGLVMSIPDNRQAAVNRLYIRTGRLPSANQEREVAVVETFANAHGFKPGDRFNVIMNGRKRELTIVGIVLSPEFIYAIGPGDMVPDPKRFGVFYMSESVLGSVFDMENSFNDLSLSTLRGADRRKIMEAVDALLDDYGGAGAYDRPDQISNAFLDSELKQLAAMAKVIPPIFLLVSAFLVNMILSRLVALEREHVGLFKALGYTNFAIGAHYAKLVILIALVGLVIGSGAGWWLGRGLTRMYAEFFSFPFLIFTQSFDLYAIAGSVVVASALAGAAKSIWSIANLPPAVAMRPPAPEIYRSFFGRGFTWARWVSQLSIMSFRQLIRRPVRSGLTTLGTSMSVALLVTALFSFDSIDYMIDVIFFQADRQDASLSFALDTSSDAIANVAALPGVIRAEPFRATQVKLRNEHREVKLSLIALPSGSQLSRILDVDFNPMDPPPNGLVISERVASKLNLRPGDMVEIELTRKGRRIAYAPMVGVAQSYVGLTAYVSLPFLNSLMRDGSLISGARVVIDQNALGDLYSEVKNTPAIAGIALQDISRQKFRETIEENIITMTTVYVTLAVIITFGVIYNSARIQLSERARELASLRVFGFTPAEVSKVLLIELSVIVLAAQPLGWLLGYLFSWWVIRGFSSDLFRIPFVVNPATFAWASIVVLSSALVSALIVRRRVNRLDLIRVLKTRE